MQPCEIHPIYIDMLTGIVIMMVFVCRFLDMSRKDYVVAGILVFCLLFCDVLFTFDMSIEL